MPHSSEIRKQSWVYFLALHILTVLLMAGFVQWGGLFSSPGVFLFLAGWLVAGSWFLALPAFLCSLLALWCRGWGRRWYRLLVYSLCAFLGFAVYLFLIADLVVLTMFGYHINGLVVNLFLTPGGVESMGLQPGNVVLILLVGILLFGFEWLLAWYLLNGRAALRLGQAMRRHWKIALLWPTGVAVCLLCGIFSEGIADYRAEASVLAYTEAYPLVPHVRMRRLLRRLGMKEVPREEAVGIQRMKLDNMQLHYPASPIVRREHVKYNLVWLVAESLRSDMLTAEIMPNSWALAARGWRFTRHYSGGHGTRPAMFSMFYGLHGNCWDSFLDRSRCPVLFDWLHEDGYSFLCQTSAKFSYPEFNRTIFASMRDSELREFSKGIPWNRDIQNIDSASEFIRQHDADSPFFLFCFFEGTHAPYSFPEDSPLLADYARNVNYATIGKKDAVPLKNRYANAAHQVDRQVGRLMDLLAEMPDVAAKTIVILTGDHGEEFFEKGRLGHNSTFVQEQIRTPLVIVVPGREPAVYDKMSSHTDILPTIAPLLGVQNPPEDYCVGGDLFSQEYTRNGFLCFGWDVAVFATQEYKYLLPIGKKSTFALNRLTTLEDAPCDDDDFLKNNAARLHQAQQEMYRFIKR